MFQSNVAELLGNELLLSNQLGLYDNGQWFTSQSNLEKCG